MKGLWRHGQRHHRTQLITHVNGSAWTKNNRKMIDQTLNHMNHHISMSYVWLIQLIPWKLKTNNKTHVQKRKEYMVSSPFPKLNKKQTNSIWLVTHYKAQAFLGLLVANCDSGSFLTGSSFSDRINSMWQGDDI